MRDRDGILEHLKAAEIIVEETVRHEGAGVPGKQYGWLSEIG
jgi:hypothetical protein